MQATQRQRVQGLLPDSFGFKPVGTSIDYVSASREREKKKKKVGLWFYFLGLLSLPNDASSPAEWPKQRGRFTGELGAGDHSTLSGRPRLLLPALFGGVLAAVSGGQLTGRCPCSSVLGAGRG